MEGTRSQFASVDSVRQSGAATGKARSRVKLRPKTRSNDRNKLERERDRVDDDVLVAVEDFARILASVRLRGKRRRFRAI